MSDSKDSGVTDDFAQRALDLLIAARQHSHAAVMAMLEALHAQLAEHGEADLWHRVRSASLASEDRREDKTVSASRAKSAVRTEVETPVGTFAGAYGIIGASPAMKKTFDLMTKILPTHLPVLVLGESGTGKELFARALHFHGPRAKAAFLSENCAAIPENLLESELFGHEKGSFTGAHRAKPGKFELADSGTIFLDEIATASPALQVKLLRVMQDRCFERVGGEETLQVDVRLILATNVDLEAEVAAGRFREDLYYRINVVTLELPPLRDRPGDVPVLAEVFLERHAQEHGRRIKGFTRDALELILAYRWPGNVRELENAIERAVVMCRKRAIGAEDLPPSLSRKATAAATASGDEGDELLPLKVALEAPERRIIERALERNDGNRQKTAQMLDVNRATLFNKMKKYGLLDR